MSTDRPPAGWYEDPTGKPGQLYWDGTQWSTPGPSAAPAPTRDVSAAVQTAVDRVRPRANKARSFFSSVPGQEKAMLAVAVLLVVLAVVGSAAAGVVLVGRKAETLFTSSGSSSDATPAVPDKSSPSYKVGYTSAASRTGVARVTHGNLPARQACDAAAEDAARDAANNKTAFDATSYKQGCLDGFREHPSGQ
jgi:hypothetical protein